MIGRVRGGFAIVLSSPHASVDPRGAHPALTQYTENARGSQCTAVDISLPIASYSDTENDRHLLSCEQNAEDYDGM
jgi:hypothetical protein